MALTLRLNRDGQFHCDPGIAGLSELTLDPRAVQMALSHSITGSTSQGVWQPVMITLKMGVWHRSGELRIMQVLPRLRRRLRFLTAYSELTPQMAAQGYRIEATQICYEAAWAPYVVERHVVPFHNDIATYNRTGNYGGRISYTIEVELPRRAWFGTLSAATGWRNYHGIKMTGVRALSPREQSLRSDGSVLTPALPARLEYRQWTAGNVHNGGRVCWGGRLQPLVDNGLANLSAADSLFFDAEFNTDLSGPRRSWMSQPGAWGLSPEQTFIRGRYFLGGVIPPSDITGAQDQ